MKLQFMIVHITTVTMTVCYLKPLFNIVEWFLIRNVVDDDDTVGSPVVWWSDGTEPLLSRSVPDLKQRSSIISILDKTCIFISCFLPEALWSFRQAQ